MIPAPLAFTRLTAGMWTAEPMVGLVYVLRVRCDTRPRVWRLTCPGDPPPRAQTARGAGAYADFGRPFPDRAAAEAFAADHFTRSLARALQPARTRGPAMSRPSLFAPEVLPDAGLILDSLRFDAIACFTEQRAECWSGTAALLCSTLGGTLTPAGEGWGPHEWELTLLGLTATGGTELEAIAHWIEIAHRSAEAALRERAA